MRQNMVRKKQTNQLKLQEELEFLNHIKELEELEKTRRLTSIKAINEDFRSSNA